MPWSNQWGYRSAALDSAVDAAAVELNPARRKALYAEFSRVANTDIPVWMAIEQLFVSATAARVRDDHNTPRWPSSAWADVWLAA
jgi:peptide/nickel transport system substrate-binding protein